MTSPLYVDCPCCGAGVIEKQRENWETGDPPEEVPLVVHTDFFSSRNGAYSSTAEYLVVVIDGELIGLDSDHPEPESTGIGIEDISRWSTNLSKYSKFVL